MKNLHSEGAYSIGDWAQQKSTGIGLEWCWGYNSPVSWHERNATLENATNFRANRGNKELHNQDSLSLSSNFRCNVKFLANEERWRCENILGKNTISKSILEWGGKNCQYHHCAPDSKEEKETPTINILPLLKKLVTSKSCHNTPCWHKSSTSGYGRVSMIAEKGVDMGSVYNNFNCIITIKIYSVTLFFIFFLFFLSFSVLVRLWANSNSLIRLIILVTLNINFWLYMQSELPFCP